MNLSIDCLLIITVLFALFENQNAQNDVDCQAIKTRWYSHKYQYSDDLLKFTTSKTVDVICPKTTCCDNAMKTEILGVSQMKLKSIAEIHLKSIIELLYNNSRDLNDFYQNNLDISKDQMNKMFLSTYASSYKDNQRFLFDFYDKLKLYMDGKEQNIEKILDTFFTEMAEKILRMSILSKNNAEKIRCLTNSFLKLNPYQNVDKAIVSNFKEAYPTARMLVNSLRAAHDVFLDLSQKLMPSIECTTKYAKAFYCSWCSLTETMPCDGLCKSIIGKCFGSFNRKEMNKINKAWKALLGALEKISNKAKHPFNFVEVNNNLHLKISEAVMNVHNFYTSIRDKLQANCENKLIRKRRNSEEESESQYFESVPKTLEISQPKPILLNDLVNKLLTKMKDMTLHLQNYKNAICSSTFKLPKQGNQCWNGAEITTGYKPNVKEKDANKNLKISPLVKTSIATLQKITAALNNILSKQVVDPDAFKIKFVEKPKITEIPRLRPSRISEQMEGSGKGGVDIENTSNKSKPKLPTIEPINEPKEIIEGSGEIKTPSNEISKNRPAFPQLPPNNINTPKPGKITKSPPIPDDEDLPTDQNENKNEKTPKPAEPRTPQIEGSGSLDTVEKSTETSKIFTTKTSTTVVPFVMTDLVKSPKSGRPDDESSLVEGSGQEEVTPRKPHEFNSRVEHETTTSAPVDLTTPSVLLPNDLPGEIPPEIWIPRVIDYDSRGPILNNPNSTCSITKFHPAMFFSLFVIYILL
uniref:Glypican-1 n=1 Tax=Schmidtea mediterranea TaxID=79327 RepID=I1ZI58_SCHMD|nr:glypican-1 [Schmidtea mediterranea]